MAMSFIPTHESSPKSADRGDSLGGHEAKSVHKAHGWSVRRGSVLREYTEVVSVIGAVTVGGVFLPLTYHTFGLIYLLVVIALSLRVGRWPVLSAAILSAVVWDYVFLPPVFSFALPESADGLLLGTYVVVALVAGQLTSQIRTQQRQEQLRERRATALYHVIRATTEARTLDEAIEAALRQADDLFNARTALLLGNTGETPFEHRASSLKLNEKEAAVADWVHQKHAPAGRFTNNFPAMADLYLPLLRAGKVYGVFVIRLPDDIQELPPMQRDLIEGFAAQLALLAEREELRAAGEREKLLAESDRLRRTLLDSVSHELKTPLAVLRSAGEKLDITDATKRAQLADEIRMATRRLDHLVANLLNQTRLESGALHAQLDWCDVRDLISSARRATSDRLAGRSFTVEIPLEMPLVMVDAPLMEQVFSNLLLNACLYTPEGSPIYFSAGVEKTETGERAFLKLQDRGPGLPDELQRKLFQKFVRGRNARAGGVGLGLAIARGFVEAQGGEITAANLLEGGACFTIYLPKIMYDSVPSDER
jgi:two-component system sensor histidine kinase KdpD